MRRSYTRRVSPDVTVVIPTKNRRALLRRALGTSLGQQQVKVEIIVVDDGSEDQTSDDVRQCEHLGVRLIRHENSLGVSTSRNEGIAAASAPWVAFLDDDDLWAPEKLALQLAQLRQTTSEGATRKWVSSGAVLVDEQDRIMGWASTGAERVDAAALLVNGILAAGGSTVVASKQALLDVGGFDESASLYEDWDLWIRMALRHGPVANVDRPLAAYRVWSSASSRVLDLEGAWAEITERYAVDAERLGVITDLDAMHRYRAYRSLLDGQHAEAAGAYRDLARTSGSRKAGAMAVAAERVGSPLLSVLSWRNRRRVPAWVRQEAQGWLNQVDGDAQRWVGDLQPAT